MLEAGFRPFRRIGTRIAARPHQASFPPDCHPGLDPGSRLVPDTDPGATGAALGCLERVDLETRWDGEPSGFAPWFLDPDRLGMLGDALGLRLEPVPGPLSLPRACGAGRLDDIDCIAIDD